ncbi:MAG: hypothetical protein GY842_16735, partial [bacterium]|nr:hypothetical protein [bacterium]
MIRDDTAEVTLPGGIWLDGEHHRGAEICPLSGRDEAFVCDRTGALPPAHLTTEVLTRNLTR